MRIVQIGAYMWGAQKIIEEGIHSCALKNGYSSYILYVRGQSDMMGALRCENRLENILTRGLRKLFGKRPQFATLQTLKIIYHLRCFHPDIVHLHVLHGATNYHLLLRYLVKAQIPVVYTMHDMWAHTGACFCTGNCVKYQNTCSSCKSDSAQLDVAKRYVAKEFFAKKKLLLSLHNLHCVAVSHWVAGEFRKGFLSEKPISVIYNGIDQENREPTEKGQHSDNTLTRIICVATSWDERKGFTTLVELARLLGKSFEMLIIGKVTDEQRKLNPGNIVFYGSCTDRKQMFSLFKNADIHVTASQAETFGMTMVEAAMAGTRSVGCSRTAIGEILNLVNGVCVDECTAFALRNAVLKIVEEGNCKLTPAEIDRISGYFSITRMAEEYMSLYESMI